METEAYDGETDAAAHSYNGKTERSAVMFNGTGLLYVFLLTEYITVQIVVTGRNNQGQAV